MTGKKDPAPRYGEISTDIERPELIIPQRTRGKRKEAYSLAVAKIGHNTGFHSALAAGASQAYDRQHQSTLLPEPKNFKGTLGDLGLQCSAEEQCLWYNDWLVIFFFFVDDVVAMFKNQLGRHSRHAGRRLDETLISSKPPQTDQTSVLNRYF